MRFRSIRAWLLPLIAATLSVVVIGGCLLLRFLDLDTYKEEIVARVKSSLNRELQYQSGDFSFRYGPSFSFRDVTVKERDGKGDFIKADRLTIGIAIVPLLHRELVLSRMYLERPTIRLSRDRAGVFNVSDLLSQGAGGAPGIRGIELSHARIAFSDAKVSAAPLVTELSDTELVLSRLVRGKNCDFKLSGYLGSGPGRVPLLLAGVAKLPARGIPLTATEVNGRLKTGALDAGRFLPYYGRYLPFRGLAGQLAVESSFKGRLAAFKTEGNLQVTRLNLDYPQVFHARLTPRSVKGSCKLELSERALEISQVKLNVDGLNVQGSCRLSDLHSGDLRITAKASTNRFSLREFRPYIPYGIIAKDVADFIEEKIPAGLYRLEQGRLDGRVSQIMHMERGQNANVLSIKARVEEGELRYGSGIPIFRGIGGDLELAGPDFLLKGMSARFGDSPFTLEGRIADYPLDTPARYLFAAHFRPKRAEAAWLLGHGRGEKLALEEGSTLKLAGEGTSALYRMSGEWDLGSVAYSYPELIVKPKGRPNALAFKGSFDKGEFRLSSCSCSLAPLSLGATAVNRYQGGMSVEVQTNQFQAAEVASFFPKAARYHPAGKVQLHLHGEGNSLEQLAFGGTVALAGASFKPSDKMKPVTAINGSIHIGSDSLESPQLSVRIGGSTISGRGTLSGFRAPSFSLSFTSPFLDLADFGFSHGHQPIRAENVHGTLSYGKDNLQIGSLSGTLGKSTLAVKGSVVGLQHPAIDLAVSSPHLELEDLAPLFAPSPGGASRFTLKAQLTAAEGKAREIPFQRLRCGVQLDDKALQLGPVELHALEGDLSGRLRIEYAPGSPHYQLGCNLQRVSAERLMHALGLKKQELTGTLSLQGELAAKGEGPLEWRKSANGSVKLRVENGSIRKFSTLSKVFSILNVSQLLKFHLPDMVTGGMPFNKISGDFSCKDGFASTQNLFLDSNAINISTVGKLDLVKNELDLIIGVQPLQTVDKVVSRIPIVGWILTGKDRSLISTYFEAKGPIENPQVTAVPVKSLAKGVLNIFKRVFELPVRLVTDTGEVLIGK